MMSRQSAAVRRMKLNLLDLLLVTTCLPFVIVKGQATTDCNNLANSANCSFYTECVERNMPCGLSGYAVGYGYHFCNAFEELKEEFTSEVSNSNYKNYLSVYR